MDLPSEMTVAGDEDRDAAVAAKKEFVDLCREFMGAPEGLPWVHRFMLRATGHAAACT